MKGPYRFELERAVTSWRAFLSTQPALESDDLDELETHLREDIARWKAEGLTDEEAFRKALRRLGTITDITGSYDPVRADRIFSRSGRRVEFAAVRDRIRSYALIAARTLKRSPGYAALNTIGLALGLAIALLTGLFVRQHTTYDRSVPEYESIYRVDHRAHESAPVYARGPRGLADFISENVPHVVSATEFFSASSFEVQYSVGQRHVRLPGFFSVDSAFVSLFGIEVIRGKRTGLLTEPDEAVLTESTARLLFGDTDPLGRTVTRFPGIEMVVSAVIADPPPKSTLRYSGLSSMSRYPHDGQVEWSRSSTRTYVKLSDPARSASATKAILAAVPAEQRENGYEILFRPLEEVHLASDAQAGHAPAIDSRILTFFGTIGGILLLLAGMNHVNLATARASARAREVGIRKAVGASRSQLVRQFSGESVLMAFMALPLALVSAVAFAPHVESVVGFPFSFSSEFDMTAAVAIVSATILIGLISGLYPAVVLSRFHPTRAFSAESDPTAGGSMLRRILVGAQVLFSMVLIASAVVTLGQLKHIADVWPGFDSSHVLVLDGVSPRHGWTPEQISTFRQVVSSDVSVERTAQGLAPGLGQWGSITWGKEFLGEKRTITQIVAGAGYFDLMHIPIVEGRAFTELDVDDSTAVIVSRRLAELMVADGTSGDSGSVIGLKMDIFQRQRTVLGVAENIRNRPLHAQDEEYLAAYTPDGTFSPPMLVRTADHSISHALEVLEGAAKRLRPDQLFEVSFLDESIEAQYVSDRRLARLFAVLAIVCVAIACLGLVGLATYSAQRRTKEIGIRKALGAESWQIVALLTKDVAIVILLSSFIGIPAVYFAAQVWLRRFSERIELGPGLFLLAAAVLTVFVAGSVAIQTIRAARRHPIESLRHE